MKIIEKNNWELISIDSTLCDIARAYDIKVYDMKLEKNRKMFE